MDLQNTFYLLGIIFMLLSITILVGIVILLFSIVKAVRDLHKNLTEKIDLVTKKATDSSNLALDIGTAVAGTVIKKAKKVFDKK